MCRRSCGLQSRVALCDHTPAQTVAGAVLGGLAAAVVFDLLR
ncbi:hypothetical protein ACFSJS_06385 [Streptomyces desertarenae]|uniref:Phosphatase PAP2 family protein n=1 Tax=Streptomyces desertarenae TaxID=2666184 RepID=A0ABW4PEZ4_9ACTN